MTNQKIENLLNVSLEVNETEREKSPSLRIGYSKVQKTWEIIVRYQGNIEEILNKYEGLQVRSLLNNYAVIITPKQYVELIAKESFIEFVEKPKRLFFQLAAGKSASCINFVQQGKNNPYGLFGKDVIVAVIDTGIDAASKQFRNEDGSTRILNIFDQTTGVEWDKNKIDDAIKNNKTKDIPGQDVIGHGTDVARIACGTDGVASKSDIIVVKMGIGTKDGFPRTTQLMEGLNYAVKKAVEYGKPLSINVSFGNNYGDHTGNSLLERFINDISQSWKCSICVGTGNEGLGSTHYGGRISSDEMLVEWEISEFESSFNMQLWKNYWDEFEIDIIAPGEKNIGRISGYNQVFQWQVDGTVVLTYRGMPSPYSQRQEIYIDIIPAQEDKYILAGIWKLRLIPIEIVEGRFDCWMPSIGSLNEKTGFVKPDGELSITIPATAQNVISVGAYNARTNIPAAFSGRGYVTEIGGFVMAKPEITAPGVDVMLGAGRNVTGTSFATPFVTGSAALLMEWGIVKKNDLYLYGEKLKSYLIKGAKNMDAKMLKIPDSVIGWGTLCVSESFPE